MNNYGHPTTLRYSRTMRPSGTEYANAIYKAHQRDLSGKLIIAICIAILGIAWSLS